MEDDTTIRVTARASNLEANVDYALGISVSDRLGIGNCRTQATGGTTITPPNGTKSATIRACSTGSATISASLTYYDTKYKEERTLLRISHNITVVESDEPCTNLTFQSATIPDQTWTTVTAVDVTLPSARGENCSPSYTLVGTSPNLGLPAGVSRRNTFELSGTPTASMARTLYTWTASDSDSATASLTFHITISTTPPPPVPCTNLTFQSATIPDQTWTTVTAVDVTLPSARGENCSPSYTLVGTSPNLGLPAGVSRRNTFELFGTPTAAMARTRYTWTASDGATASRTFHITISTPPPPPVPCTNLTFQSATIPDQTWTTVTAVDVTLPSARGENCSPSYTLVGTSPNLGLPAGVSRRNTFELSGTPTASMARTLYTWTASDSDSATASLTFHITISTTPPPPVPCTPSFSGTVLDKSWTTATVVDFTLPMPQLTGQNCSLGYSLTPALPSGVTRIGKTVSGTPTAAMAQMPYMWRVTDSNGGATATISFNITVTEAPLPTITISRPIPAPPSIKEGTVAALILISSAAPNTALDVEVSVTRGLGTVPTPVTIEAGRTTARFELQTEDDTIDEPVETVTVAVVDGSDYNLGSTSSVDIKVSDDDLPPAPAHVLANGHRADSKITLQWSGVSRADSYNVRYIKEACDRGGCDLDSNDNWQTVSVVTTTGGAQRQAKLDWPDDRTNILHRVQVQTVNVDMEVSEWPETSFALVYPTDSHPSSVGTSVATIPLHSFQADGQFNYVICVPPNTSSTTIPRQASTQSFSPLPFEGAEDEIMNGINEWVTGVNWYVPVDGNIVRANGSVVESCEVTDLDSQEQSDNQFVFYDEETTQNLCGANIIACWTDRRSFRPGTIDNPQFMRSIVLSDSENWIQIDSGGCTRLYAYAIHESGHAYGMGHATLKGFAMTGGLTRSYTPETQVCRPTPYDVVAMMANYQSRLGETP